MKKHTLFLSVIAMLAVPAFALAQHPAPAPTPASSEAPAVSEAGEELEDFISYMLDEDDDWVAAAEDADDDKGGAGGHRIVERHVIKNGDGPGMGMMHGGMGGPGMHAGRKGGHRRGMHQRIMARLHQMDLTDAQRDKMRDIHEGMMRKNIQRQADTKLAMMDLHKAMSAESPSATTVNAQIDKVTKLRADGMKSHFDAMMQAKAVLTPEQWKKLHSPGPMGGAGGPGGHGGPGGMRGHGGMHGHGGGK
jgi:Spy/CpxP family protein refolding chaperone